MSYGNIYATGLWFYSYPQIKNVTVIRCDANGVADDSGTYLKISATRNYSKTFQYAEVTDWPEENRCEIRYRYRQIPNGSYSAWTTILDKDNLTTDSVITGALAGTLDDVESYEVIVGVKDTAGSEINTSIILTVGVFMHRDGAKNSISIGEKVTEENTVSIAEKITAIIKGLLKTYGGIRFCDKNGNIGAYANSNVIAVQTISGEFAEASMGADHISVGSGVRGFASLNYDPKKKRGYIFVGDAPENPTDATNKAYVDAKINALRKELGLEEE